MELQLMLPLVVTVAFCVAAVVFTLICLQCRSIPLLSKSRKEERTTIPDDEESAVIKSDSDDNQTLSERVNKSDDVTDEESCVLDTQSNDNRPASEDADKSEVTIELPEINIHVEQELEKEPLSVALEPCTEHSTDPSADNPQERESVMSLGLSLAPPICGTVDFCRQSYGYISPNSRLRPSVTIRPEVISEMSDSHRSEMFFDARSTISRFDTLSSWRREIENMSAFTGDFLHAQGPRNSILSKSYDASSEDSYDTAVESSSNPEADFEKRNLCKLPMKKRLMSRKSRSMQRISSAHKEYTTRTGYSFIWNSDTRLCGGNGHTLSLKKGCITEVLDRDTELEDTDNQLLLGEMLHGCNSRTEPPTRLNRRGVYGGSLKDKVRQGSLKTKINTLPHETEKINHFLPKDDACVAKPGLVSSTDIYPPPRSRSQPNIFLTSLSQESNKRKTTPEKPRRHPSLTVWCPPSSTGVQFTMNVSRKSDGKRSPKPCSAPPEVEYVNFKGSVKR